MKIFNSQVFFCLFQRIMALDLMLRRSNVVTSRELGWIVEAVKATF